MSGQVNLSSVGSLWTSQPPVIEGEGFVPVTEMRLVTTCRDASGRNWSSQNGYLVSAEASFSTELTAAVGDDYYGIAAEGPIYSLKCQDGPGHDFHLPEDGVLKFHYQVFDGSEEVWAHSTERHHSRTPEKPAGVHIAFFHNGTAGARHGVEILRSHGFGVTEFPVLADDNNDLRPSLSLLEELLKGPEKVHAVGSARASEALLEVAQRVQGLASVVVYSGSGLRFSPWFLGDSQALEHVVCDHASLQPRPYLKTRTVYAEAVADRDNRDKGRIAVEKVDCPLYLFSGSDDQVWPSAAFSELAAQRRKAHGLESATFHRTYPNVGYDLGPELGLPGLPTTERSMAHSSTGTRLLLGGKMGRQARARRDCWESLMRILAGEGPTERPL